MFSKHLFSVYLEAQQCISVEQKQMSSLQLFCCAEHILLPQRDAEWTELGRSRSHELEPFSMETEQLGLWEFSSSYSKCPIKASFLLPCLQENESGWSYSKQQLSRDTSFPVTLLLCCYGCCCHHNIPGTPVADLCSLIREFCYPRTEE